MKVWNENYRLRRMAELCRNRRRVLDIGCTDHPNPYLRNERLVGFDIARRELPANYADFQTGDVMNLPQPFEPGSFDAVVAGEILEHLERPVDFLRGCLALLESGGLLVLSTPNPNSPIERLLTLNLSRQWFYDGGHYDPYDHVCLFPQRWLIRMMEIAGFVDVRLYSGGFLFPFAGLIPCPRPWCYQTIATGVRPAAE